MAQSLAVRARDDRPPSRTEGGERDVKGPVEPSTQMRGSEFAVRGSAAGLAQEIAAGRATV